MISMQYEREMKLKEVAAVSWSVYRARFRTIAQITVAVYLPINVLLYFLMLHVDKVSTSMRIVQMSEMFGGIVAAMGVSLLTKEWLEGTARNWKEYLTASVAQWGIGVQTMLWMTAITAMMTLLLVVPGIIWCGYYAFATQTVILRGLQGRAALADSKRLVKGRWWRVCGKLVVLAVPPIGLTLVAGAVSCVLPEGAEIVINTVGDIIGSAISVAATVLFLNLDALAKTHPAASAEQRAVE